ncbi:MAG: hypothetical protein KDI28_05850 [Pseudomonadales bacterium]|nr:hypothetical protein [Pseudomonadales bacterium]
MRVLLVLIALVALQSQAAEEQTLATARWFTVQTENFDFFSRLSREQTEQRALAFEQWRQAALEVLGVADTQSRDPIRTAIYLFEDDGDFALFADNNDPAYLYSSPRENFIIARNSDAGFDLAQHHYAHFLINNNPAGVPRWYEEGMGQYLGRLEATRDGIELRALTAEETAVAAAFNRELGMDELLYDDAALASPRQIQIANLKAAFLVQFLLHGHEHDGFADRRDVLRRYLEFLQQGRNDRFAYDQSFKVSVRRLSREFEDYLDALQKKPDETHIVFPVTPVPELQVREIVGDEVELALAELALFSGRFPMARFLFDGLKGSELAGGRAWSGFADAIRMSEDGQFIAVNEAPVADDLESLYEQAIAVSPQDYQLYLDFGQFYDASLSDCQRPLDAAERQRMESEMARRFGEALALNPQPAEVNLSYAQLFLLEGKDWHEGLVYQDKAFALLPSDTFVLEQQIEYAIAARDFDRAEALIDRMARPMHFLGDAPWISELRERLRAARRGRAFDPCAEVMP